MDDPLIAYAIIVAFIIGNALWLRFLWRKLGRKDQYRDSVSSSRNQHELLNKK